jgi:hypothetical protein
LGVARGWCGTTDVVQQTDATTQALILGELFVAALVSEKELATIANYLYRCGK